MISGKVELVGMIQQHPLLKPRVAITVASESGNAKTLEATVDTGTTAWLTLPPQTIRELGLRYAGTRPVELADGSHQPARLYVGFISWYDQTLVRLIYESDSEPLLGMGLLLGSKLSVEVLPNGAVTIEQMTIDT